MFHTFSIVSAAQKDQTITFESEHSVYQEALLEATEKDLIPLAGNYTQIKVSSKSEDGTLLKPYFYAIAVSNGKKFVMNGADYAFNENPSNVPDGTLLGMFEVEEYFKNTPFYGFGVEQWKRFFEGVKESGFRLVYRQYTKNQIIDILNVGGSIHVNEVRFMNTPSEFAFQVVPAERSVEFT